MTFQIILVLLLFTYMLQGFQLVLLLNGAILSNFLMFMLPNALYLYQINYGYLKFRESRHSYMASVMIFYLSMITILYVVIRALQQLFVGDTKPLV